MYSNRFVFASVLLSNRLFPHSLSSGEGSFLFLLSLPQSKDQNQPSPCPLPFQGRGFYSFTPVPARSKVQNRGGYTFVETAFLSKGEGFYSFPPVPARSEVQNRGGYTLVDTAFLSKGEGFFFSSSPCQRERIEVRVHSIIFLVRLGWLQLSGHEPLLFRTPMDEDNLLSNEDFFDCTKLQCTQIGSFLPLFCFQIGYSHTPFPRARVLFFSSSPFPRAKTRTNPHPGVVILGRVKVRGCERMVIK